MLQGQLPHNLSPANRNLRATIMHAPTLLQLLFYSGQSLSFFFLFLEGTPFVFQITFHHLVKQYTVLVKNENITDKSQVPLGSFIATLACPM